MVLSLSEVVKMSNFLDTKTAVEKYATLAIRSRGDRAKMENAWKDICADNGVTITEDLNEDDILPKRIIGSINDSIKSNSVFSQFHPVFDIQPGELVLEKDENSDGAWGHKTNATKKIQQTNLISRTIFPKAIYKLQKLDHMTYLKGGALVQWVLSELPRYVVNRVSQAILVGGVKNEDGTNFDAIRPIIGDELAVATTLAKGYSGEDLKKSLLTDIASVDSDDVTVFLSPTAWAELATAGDAWSVGMLTGNGLNLGGNIVKTFLLDDTHPYVIVDTNDYLLGFAGSGVETLADFAITSNSEYIESRAYVAGSLMRAGIARYATAAASN